MPSEGNHQGDGRCATEGCCTAEDQGGANVVTEAGVSAACAGAVAPFEMVGGGGQRVGNRPGLAGKLGVARRTSGTLREMGAQVGVFGGIRGPQLHQFVLVKTAFHRSLRRASRKRRIARKSCNLTACSERLSDSATSRVDQPSTWPRTKTSCWRGVSLRKPRHSASVCSWLIASWTVSRAVKSVSSSSRPSRFHHFH